MEATKHLKRYLKVQRNEMPTIFKITEKVSVQFDPSCSLKNSGKFIKKALKNTGSFAISSSLKLLMPLPTKMPLIGSHGLLRFS
jgi:uncharacterized Fe-S radical SAM superfamily protein PflX